MTARPDDPLRSARILIVDDERQNRTLMEVMLEPEGYVLETAENGEAALAIAAQRVPNLVLLDVMMPGMNGYVVASRLKADPRTRAVSVILLSSLDDPSSKTHGLGAGADAFLSKPVSRAELVTLVRQQLLRADATARGL
jgi:CheY-like chemotaxis protein